MLRRARGPRGSRTLLLPTPAVRYHNRQPKATHRFSVRCNSRIHQEKFIHYSKVWSGSREFGCCGRLYIESVTFFSSRPTSPGHTTTPPNPTSSPTITAITTEIAVELNTRLRRNLKGCSADSRQHNAEEKSAVQRGDQYSTVHSADQHSTVQTSA